MSHSACDGDCAFTDHLILWTHGWHCKRLIDGMDRRFTRVLLCPALRSAFFCVRHARSSNWDKVRLSSLKQAVVGSEVGHRYRKRLTGIRENIVTYPNGLSLCRILLTPVLSVCILNHHYYLSLAVFAAAGITDALDGFIARNYSNQKSVLGSVLDPLADKLLVTTTFISLTAVNLIPVPLTVSVIGRDTVLIVWSVWVRHKTLPDPKSLRQFFDLGLATAEIKPSLLGKWNTAVQLLAISCAILSPVTEWTGHPLLSVLFFTTGVTTLLSGWQYVAAGGAYVRIKSKK